MAKVVVSGADRAHRSLINLQATASSARTLSLHAIWRRHRDEAEHREGPFFHSPLLNRSIIVKHRLRPNEQEDMPGDKQTVTKVIIPIDPTDLRVGARSFFINQRGYDAFIDEVAVGHTCDQQDAELLQVLDELPSLDPFLMRERLEKTGIRPAPCYFELTEADTARMFDCLRSELKPLIGMSFDALDISLNEKVTKLATKMLGNAGDKELEPLRQGMGLPKAQFEEGMFCWKGFIYYKWTLGELLPKIRPVCDEIAQIRPSGPAADEDKAYIAAARSRLRLAVAGVCDTVRATLNIYEEAYAELTRKGQPQAFREFLVAAPDLFYDLGEQLGVIHHVVSFWRFRFPNGARAKVCAEELADLLADFEMSLSFSENQRAA